MEDDLNIGELDQFDLSIEDFSDIELELELEFETRYIKPPRTQQIAIENLKYSNAEKLAKEISIAENDRYFVVVNGTFIFGDFIEALIVEENYKVKQLTISTLSMSENNVDSFANLLNGGYVDELNLIVSDYFYSHERHDLVPYIYKELDKDNKFQFAAAGTHCKIALIETECNKKIILHGSCNLRSSSNIEQFVIEENKALFDFNQDYQNAIIEKYKTIDKAVRGKELWKTITQ